jgi:hypothetical protein
MTSGFGATQAVRGGNRALAWLPIAPQIQSQFSPPSNSLELLRYSRQNSMLSKWHAPLLWHSKTIWFIILSDNQSAIQALANPFITSRTVLQTVEALDCLGNQGKEVCVQWVRGHNDTDGNDLADYMANQGAVLTFLV